jgi:hypothetical protein
MFSQQSEEDLKENEQLLRVLQYDLDSEEVWLIICALALHFIITIVCLD